MISTMQEYYRKRAGFYDQSMGYDRPEVVAALQPVIDLLCATLTDRDVLEVACGPGFWTSFVAEHARNMLATDFNEETLVEARKKGLDSGTVSFCQADAYDLPDFGRLFTGCLSIDWFCHVPVERIDEFLVGLHGRLTPGAVVAFSDQLPKKLPGSFDEHGNHLQIRSLPDGSTHSVIKNFFDEERLAGIISKHGSDFTYRAFPECGRYVLTYLPGLG